MATKKLMREDRMVSGPGKASRAHRRLYGCLFVLGAWGMAEEVVGQAEGTLRSYLTVALAENPGLKAAEQKYLGERARVPQAEGFPDPRFMVEVMRTRTGPEETEFWIRQELPWPGKRRLRGEMARRGAEAAYEDYRGKLLEVVLRTGEAFFDYAYLGRTTEITGRTLALTQRLEKAVEEEVRGGGDLARLLRLQVEEGKIRDEMQGLEKDRRSQAARLRALMGKGESGQVLPFPSLREEVPGRGSREALARAMREGNPELNALATRVRGAESAEALARRAVWPDPMLGLGAFDMGSSEMRDGEVPYGVDLEFRVPLWRGKYRAEREEAEARRRALEEEWKDRENTLAGELEAAWQELEEAEDRLTLFRDSLLPRARQSLEVTEASYRAGRATVLEWIDTERTVLELEKTYWRTVADRQIQHLRLQVLAGQGVP